MFKFKKRQYTSEIDVFLNSLKLARVALSASQQAEIEYHSRIALLRDHSEVADVRSQRFWEHF